MPILQASFARKEKNVFSTLLHRKTGTSDTKDLFRNKNLRDETVNGS